MIFDLHSHSTASDGVLTPKQLVLRAADQGVRTLALTDHDGVRGIAEAREQAAVHGMELVAGAEVSVTWNKRTIHVVGLRLDIENPTLLAGLASNRAGRNARAERIAAALAEAGIEGAYEGAYVYAENEESISRTHFARFLIDKGHVKNMKTVFKKFLTQGKPGYVSHQWAELQAAVTWITAAGGQAVLAHPGRYDLGRELMERLIGEFKEAGGVGIEVVTGSQGTDHIPVFARYAERFGLMASVGSDFHAPGEGGRELGRLKPLPDTCRPIWESW